MKPQRFALEVLFEEFEHVPDMYVLGSSDARTRPAGDLLEWLGVASWPDLRSLTLGYSEVQGLEELRAVIAGMYAGVSADQVLVTVGATEAIFLALHTLLGPGDEALVCQPAFQALWEMARVAGARVIPYAYREDAAFQPDIDAIRACLSGARPPKVLVLNTPHNPTGQAMDEACLAGLLTDSAAVGTTAVVDEVFAGIWLGARPPVPSAVALNARAVVIGSLSKAYGLPGLRIGWLVGPREFIQECKVWRHYTTNCPPLIVQHLAVAAIQHRELILSQNRAIAQENLGCALSWLCEHEEFFAAIEPQAGLVMLLRLKLPVDTTEFIRDVAHNQRVFLIPCTSCFGMPNGYIRLGIGGDPGRFAEGLSRLSAYVRSKQWRRLRTVP